MKIPWDIEIVNLTVTKHFSLKYMRNWSWDFHDLRDAIREAYSVNKVGNDKYEIYVNKAGYKKIITVFYDEENRLLCITGSQGGTQK